MPTPSLKVTIHHEDDKGNVFTLLEPIRHICCMDGRILELNIPAGFASDGASVPRFFWRAVFPPGDTHALYAAFVHDYIYRTHPVGWTKSMADRLFLELLIEGGVPCKRAYRAYLGVALFGRKAWNEGGEK